MGSLVAVLVILELLPSRAEGPLLQSASEPLTSEQVAGSEVGDIGAPEPAVPVESRPDEALAGSPPVEHRNRSLGRRADCGAFEAQARSLADEISNEGPGAAGGQAHDEGLRALALVPLARRRRCDVLLRQIPSKRESLLCRACIRAAGLDTEVAQVHAGLVSLDRPRRHRTPVSRSRKPDRRLHVRRRSVVTRARWWPQNRWWPLKTLNRRTRRPVGSDGRTLEPAAVRVKNGPGESSLFAGIPCSASPSAGTTKNAEPTNPKAHRFSPANLSTPAATCKCRPRRSPQSARKLDLAAARRARGRA